MTAIRLSGLALALITATALPLAAMEIHVHVQDATTTDPLEAAYVRYIFNPGTAVTDTAEGYTNLNGDLSFIHNIVSSVNDIPSFAMSRPYPNPTGSTAFFDFQNPDKASSVLTISLYDLRGRLRGKGDVGAGAVSLDRPLPSGNYLYRVDDRGSMRSSGKLTVLGQLTRIEFRPSAIVSDPKAFADAVDILVQADGYDDYTHSQSLSEGNHSMVFHLEDPTNPPAPLELEQLTFDFGMSPTVSPDGRRFAFKPSGRGLVVQSLVDGTRDTILDFGRDPSWHKTQDLIVVESDGLCVVDLATRDTTWVAKGSNLETPDWSPSGAVILTNGRSPDGAYLTDYPYGSPVRVDCSEPDGSWCAGEGPSFSGDGQWIAFEDGLEILKVPSDGGTSVEVVGGLRDTGEPAWSPDNKYIAFSMQNIERDGWNIWVSDARGMDFGLWQLTSGNGFDFGLTWSPDSRVVFFSRAGNIWRIGFDPALKKSSLHP